MDNIFNQNVIVMRHGDRMDNFEPMWAMTADKPWDPPLIDAGKTAAEVVTAVCAKEEDPTAISSEGVAVDASKVKVAIELGLCEVLNSQTMRGIDVPADEDWGFKLQELESLFPSGTVDHSVKPIYKAMPKWGEDQASARKRYAEVIKSLADKYPTENLLLVTHGEAVGVAVSAFLTEEQAEVYEVDYCAHAHLTRSISYNNDQPCTEENLECKGRPGENG